MSGAQDWATPPDFWAWINGIFQFDVDVCATKDNAKCDFYITPEMDAFKTDWFWNDNDIENPPQRAYCNPGFSNALRWHKRAFEQVFCDPGTLAVVMGIQGASQEWYEFAMQHATHIWHLSPRVQYVAPPGVKQSSNNNESTATIYTTLGGPATTLLNRWSTAPRRARWKS